MSRRVHYHNFRGVKYEVDVEEPHHGSCDSPKRKPKHPVLVVNEDISTLKGLKILIHECCHAGEWKLPEEVVDQMGEDIGRLLWRLGFRRVKCQKTSDKAKN
jgi:hypothetical protein